MRSLFVYTGLRLALFGAVFGVLWVLGAKSWLALLLAVLVSGILSFVLLSRQRDAVSATVTGRADTMRERFSEGAAREDDKR